MADEQSEQNAMRLEVIAAKAKQLAYDVKHGKLWEGDLARGLSDIHEQLRYVRERS